MAKFLGGFSNGSRVLLLVGAGLFLCAVTGLAALKALDMWRARLPGFTPYALEANSVTIPAALSAPEQQAHFFAANVPAPLIVDLHPWSSALGSAAGDNGLRLDELAYRNSWSYIRPTLTGHNRNPDGCCSEAVIDAIKTAIAYARKHAQVTSVHVIGGSGGGYTALCGAMSEKLEGIASYQAWVPVTDLELWHRQRPGVSYERDILACTASPTGFDVAEARRRSPMHMPVPAVLPKIHLYAGVHDGFAGDLDGKVPITHSVGMYNRLSKVQVTADVLLQLLEARKGPQSSANVMIDGRQIHLSAQDGPVSLTIFEGSHEVLAKAAMDVALEDAAAAKTPSR